MNKLQKIKREIKMHERFIRSVGINEKSTLGDYLDLLKTCQEDVAINLLGHCFDVAGLNGILKEMQK